MAEEALHTTPMVRGLQSFNRLCYNNHPCPILVQYSPKTNYLKKIHPHTIVHFEERKLNVDAAANIPGRYPVH